MMHTFHITDNIRACIPCFTESNNTGDTASTHHSHSRYTTRNTDSVGQCSLLYRPPFN
jgi:hypothetical protein